MCIFNIYNTIFNLLLLPLYANGNYNLYELTAYNAYERTLLYYLHLKNPNIIFMNGISNEAAIPMDVIVRNDTLHKFENKLNSFDIQYTLVSRVSKAQLLYKKKTLAFNISSTFYDWEIIESWIKHCEKSKNSFKKTVIAKTFERRDIFVLKISKGKRKPIVFIVGGEDGMDWMSSSLVLNLFNDLLNKISTISALSTKFDFYLLPNLNPDGYVYSQKQARLWSKNRRLIYPKRKCPDGNYATGINIDRNWLLQKPSQLVEEGCNSINFGHKALSEDETEALSYVLNSLSLDMIAFINIKGFGRYITIPFGHTYEPTNNHDIVLEVLRSTCSKLEEEHNVTYYIGTTAKYFYNYSGNMADWVKFKLNTPIVYTVYLENEDTVLPLSRHIKNLKEQLITILKESLLISYDIYRPLFNNETNVYDCFNYTVSLTIFFNLIVDYIIN